MTTPREPSGPDRDRWDGGEYPPIERHPGFDRYPPPNSPTRRGPLPPLDPDRFGGSQTETRRHPAAGAGLPGRQDPPGRTPRRVFPNRPQPPHGPEPELAAPPPPTKPRPEQPAAAEGGAQPTPPRPPRRSPPRPPPPPTPPPNTRRPTRPAPNPPSPVRSGCRAS
ncbi:hypothetical protein [Nocardia brasiliensis]|uniref:hypothetical protein n=1 Tax=Nocardia brasiliensis TaxID=37326 RepID=UPI002455A167|nr:hypothetical protein [Nocardia brasiliensis]